MTEKNKEKLERRERRKPPIPYTKVGPSKKDIVRKMDQNSKRRHYENY